MIRGNETLKDKREAKQKKKLQMAATSLVIITASMLGASHNAEAITMNTNGVPHISKNKVTVEDEINLYQHYKMEQIKIETERRAREAQLEQERIQKEQEAARLKKAKENFFYIVKHKDVTYTDLRTASGLTVEEANAILKGTGLEGLGKGFVDAEKNNSVNAYYLMAHAAWESTWGTSSLAVNKNNLFGFTAYDASPGSSATSFASKEDCINTVAAYINNHYLSDNGQYHNGPNLHGMNIKYASDENWARGIGDVIGLLVEKTEKL